MGNLVKNLVVLSFALKPHEKDPIKLTHYHISSCGAQKESIMKKLDCQGLECPLPVVKCRDFIKSEKPSICQILVDNETSSINVGRYLEKQNYLVRVIHDNPRLWRVCACQDEKGGIYKSDEDFLSASTFKTLVLITSERMGSGDDELGSKLMATFLATLPELGENLWRIVLLNGGVKLTAQEGPALEALVALKKAGVSILVCGACLNHFHLTDKKAVGETSNMLDILTSMDLAQKIIRP